MPSPDPFPRILRVKIEPIEHLTYRAKPTDEPYFEFYVDEPQDRGGNEKGPSRITYFLTAVAAESVPPTGNHARDTDLHVLHDGEGCI